MDPKTLDSTQIGEFIQGVIYAGTALLGFVGLLLWYIYSSDKKQIHKTMDKAIATDEKLTTMVAVHTERLDNQEKRIDKLEE